MEQLCMVKVQSGVLMGSTWLCSTPKDFLMPRFWIYPKSIYLVSDFDYAFTNCRG